MSELRWHVRSFLLVHLVCLTALGAPIDYADATQLDAWLRHPVLGDASFDSFVHASSNPMHRGAAPYEWPVNGFLFEDPVSGNWYTYVGEYCKGYAMVEDAPSRCVVFRSKDKGKTWERIGPAIEGRGTHIFEGELAALDHAPDVSVIYADGRYHMAFDFTTFGITWENAANPPKEANSGVGYAWSDKPEGPFHPTSRPVATTRDQELLQGKYRRLYASSIIRRANDWVVLTLTDSGPHFSWALLGMKADKPEGPYTKPQLLLHPELDRFYPPLLEFFPAFVHEGFVYSPTTSVAANRNYQGMFRAPMESMLEPNAWEYVMHGSVWHADPVEHEYHGIWGQAFSGFVGKDGAFHVMFPSRDSNGMGTINFAERRWNAPYRERGFVVSGHEGPSLALLKRGGPLSRVEMEARTHGTVSLVWDYSGPLGPNKNTSGSTIHPLTLSTYSGVELSPGAWTLVMVDAQGQRSVVAEGKRTNTEEVSVAIPWDDSGVASLELNGSDVWSGPMPNGPGILGVLTSANSHASVSKFIADAPPSRPRISYHYVEALLNAAQKLDDWTVKDDVSFRFGVGCVSKAQGARVKWNVEGISFAMWGPKGPDYGKAEVFVDGASVGIVDFHSDAAMPSSPVFTHKFQQGTLHGVRVQATEGVMPVDSIDVEL